MTVELPNSVEKQLRSLAKKQGRSLDLLLADAVRQYIEASSITDLDDGDVAATQLALVDELPAPRPWRARRR